MKEETRAASPQIWRRLFGYCKPYAGRVVLGFGLAVLAIGTDLLNPWLMGLVITDYIGGKPAAWGLGAMAGVYLAAAVIQAVSAYAREYVLNDMGQSIIHKLRADLCRHIQFMPFKYFDNTAAGVTLTRATGDVEALAELFSGVIVAFMKDGLLLVGIVAAMLLLNVKLAVISFAILPFIIVITICYNKYAKANFRYVRTLTGRLNAFFAENLSGMRLVQLFGREKEKYDEFSELNAEFNRASVLGVMLNALFKPASELINSLAITLLIWFCAGDALSGALDVGVLFAFITYTRRFFAPINDLADKYATIQTGGVSAERIFELLDETDGLEDTAAGQALSNARGRIEFKNVWFAYTGENWALRDVSFVIEPGETAAFVGATGSGKTTILNLLARFYPIAKGEILLDGVNVNDYSLASLRRNLVTVMQEPFLFAGDIAANIRLGEEAITAKDVRRASRLVNAHGFIERLPMGYNEPVRERGVTMSSGERQLVSFARAVAFNPAVLALDEATASVDAENERVIQESLAAISKDRTTLVVAHRLSTVRGADKIFVLHGGRIRERGSHEELMELGGIYKKLYDLMAG